MPDFISPDVWLPNPLDLNPVDYIIWRLMQKCVYIVQDTVRDTSNLKQRLIDTWASISQNVIDEAVGQHRKRVRASMKAKG